MRLQKVEKKSLTLVVYEELKEQILTGRIAPGSRLLEVEISSQMGVSRAPVREALRMLEAERLILFQVNQGAIVRILNKEETWEIYTARSLIEGYVASLAAKRAGQGDIARLKQALDAVLQVAKSDDFELTVAKDFEFHRLIWEISNHHLFFELLTDLEGQIRMFMALQAHLFTNLIDSVDDHIEIFTAIANGDAESASSAIQKHITQAGTLVMRDWEKLAEHQEPDSI
jgi:DNA-binding GntR family transcriptional regulator